MTLGKMLAALLLAATMAVSGASATHAAEVDLPPGGKAFDYQLSGPDDVPKKVRIAVRDREDPLLEGRYNVCYVNGFQIQPHERKFWRKRPALVLRYKGKPVVDEAWNEWLLDIRTAKKRKRIARIIGRWTGGCADDGFDAVEFDNLDSFYRGHGLIKKRHSRAHARLLVKRAHRAGLAAAQKNWAEFDGRRVGYDFAIAEECGRYRECGRYVATYGKRVLVVEYRRKDFKRACKRWGDRLGILLRDRQLKPGAKRRWC